MTKTNLIESLEKAEGPCRELDALVWIAHVGANPEWENGELLMTSETAPKARLGWIDPGVEQRNFSLSTAWEKVIPAYTSSIDAALTLVSDGLHWGAGKVSETSYIAKIWADKKTGYIAEVMASSPSLSLSAAALSAMGDDDER